MLINITSKVAVNVICTQLTSCNLHDLYVFFLFHFAGLDEKIPVFHFVEIFPPTVNYLLGTAL